MAPQLPALSPEQRAAALQKAHDANRDRRDALGEITNGTLAIADALAGRDARLHRTKVDAVLRAVPRIGKVRAADLMSKAQINSGRRVRGLGDVQRKKLEDLLAA